jgi:hypothetical protein
MSKRTESKTNKTAIITDYGKEIAGYTVKPWGLMQIAALTPTFEKIAQNLKARGITFTALKAAVESKELTGLDGILFALAPELPAIVCLSLGIKPDELNKITADNQMAIIYTIIVINLAYLKNWLSPFIGITEAATTAS